MSWQYAIRERRLVELFHGGGFDGTYAVLGWRDAPYILRDIRWVISGVWADWRARA